MGDVALSVGMEEMRGGEGMYTYTLTTPFGDVITVESLDRLQLWALENSEYEALSVIDALQQSARCTEAEAEGYTLTRADALTCTN